MRNRIHAISNWASVIGIPVLLAIGGITITYMLSDAAWSGRIEEKLETIKADASRVEADVMERFDGLDASIQKIAARVRESETDPFALVAKAGYQVSKDVVAGTIDGQMVLFPRTDAAKASLEEAGMVSTKVTPFLEGWHFKAAP